MDLAKTGIDMGTVPDWVAAVGTSSAAIIAVMVLGREILTRREAALAELTDQARRVLCWLEEVELDHPYFPPGEHTTRSLAVVLRNGSDAPVFDCRAHVEVDPTVLAELENVGHRRLAFSEPILPPGDTQHTVYLPPRVRTASLVWMTFTDANGTRWSRSSSGKLGRLVDGPLPVDRPSWAGRVRTWVGRTLARLRHHR